MKKLKKSNIKQIFFQQILPIFVILFGFSYIVLLTKSTVKGIAENRGYSIATIVSYSGQSSSIVAKGATVHNGSSLRISYYDRFSKTNIDAFASLGSIPRNAEKQIGNKFVVVYNTHKPKDCILLTKYPVKDSTDFVGFMERFKVDPPVLDKYDKFKLKKK